MRRFKPRKLATIGALALVWCGLWGELSVPNFLAGLAIAIAVDVIGVGTPGRGGIHLLPLLRLILLVAVDMVRSTFFVAVEIVRPSDRTDESIIAVNAPLPTRDHFLLLVVAITLTPGTAVVDADPDNGTLYIHLLHDRRREEAIVHVRQLAQLACLALPTP